jgi:hypothetical protein
MMGCSTACGRLPQFEECQSDGPKIWGIYLLAFQPVATHLKIKARYQFHDFPVKLPTTSGGRAGSGNCGFPPYLKWGPKSHLAHLDLKSDRVGHWAKFSALNQNL